MPIKDYEYQMPDMDPLVAVALITTHAIVHVSSHSVMPAAKVEKVEDLCISSAKTTEDWQCFRSRWSDYVKATKLSSTDKVIQLLRRMLRRSTVEGPHSKHTRDSHRKDER